MTDTASNSGRIERRFEALKAEERGGLVTFITAGDPCLETSAEILRNLPEAGADIIELGMPFSDPMADGPAIQEASIRALKSGMTLKKTLSMVHAFREGNQDTPLVLMGYFNPIFDYGVEAFLRDAKEAGVDGLIVVDLPPEEDEELCLPAMKAGVHFIRLATPTTDEKRLPKVMQNTDGFVYYVSVAGVTGTKSVPESAVSDAVKRLKSHTKLPIAVGFGITSPEQAGKISKAADAAVVGSAIVARIAGNLEEDGLTPKPSLVPSVLGFVSELAVGVRSKP